MTDDVQGVNMGTAEDHDLLLRLEGKVDRVLETIGQIPGLSNRITALEIAGGAQAEQLTTIRGEVDKLRNTGTTWSVLNSIAIAVGTFLGMSR